MSKESVDWDLLSSYAGLLSLATLSIYVGSQASVPTAKSKKTGADGKEEEDDDDDDDVTDRLSSEDAWLFPVFGSCALFGLYLVVKYLGKEWINWLLGLYFALAGVGACSKSAISLVRWTMGVEKWKRYDKLNIRLTKGAKELESFSFRTPSLLLIPVGAIPSLLYTFTTVGRKSAVLTDLLALSFSHNALALLRIDSFKTGCILLSGLFLYDIWWVFGTEVMVKVATNLDVPIKILWPKSAVFDTARGFTMLGLGDIVIPGTFIALALRYDHFRHTRAGGRVGGAYPKPYFAAAMAAYVAGLATTMAVMHVFRAAQPALLYLSPACILSFLITATLRGELKDAWTFSDDPEKEKKEKEDAQKAADEAKAGEKAPEPAADAETPVPQVVQ